MSIQRRQKQNPGGTLEKRLLPMQPGDVPDTWADVSALRRNVGHAPNTSIEEGVQRFVAWYRHTTICPTCAAA